MIQRIQSIYLFLAAAFGISLFCFPFAEIVTGGNNVALTVCRLSPAVEGVSAAAMTPLALVTSLFVVLCLIALFKFRNRAMQMKITKLCGYLQILIFVAMIAFIIGLSKTPGSDKLTVEASFCLPMAFPIVNFILLILAHRGIKKDDDLVKSADRLR